MEIDKIYNKDCLVGMRDIPDKSHDLRVSVPTVYNKIKRCEIKSIAIDGIRFCVEEE